MGRAVFGSGTRRVNKVVICQRCEVNKKLAIDKYCIKCQIAVKDGKPSRLKSEAEDVAQKLLNAVGNMDERSRMILLAKLLMQEDFVIFDTETTGLGRTDEIVSISIINETGKSLLTSLVKPTRPITNSYIHGITDERVVTAPGFPRLYPRICEALDDKTVLAYNYVFDSRMLDQDCKRYNLQPIVPRESGCIMEMYAQFYGEWNDYRQDYRWQKLPQALKQLGVSFPGDNHDAIADCRAALEVLKAMAAMPLEVKIDFDPLEEGGNFNRGAGQLKPEAV